jgi:hypothetical protein
MAMGLTGVPTPPVIERPASNGYDAAEEPLGRCPPQSGSPGPGLRGEVVFTGHDRGSASSVPMFIAVLRAARRWCAWSCRSSHRLRMIAVLIHSRSAIESAILRRVLPHFGGWMLWRT